MNTPGLVATNENDQVYVNQRILPGQFRNYAIDVPVNATNLTITLGQVDANVQVFMRRGALPTLTVYDKAVIIPPPGGIITLTPYDSPPLSPGMYYVRVYNPPGSVTQTLDVRLTVGLNLEKDAFLDFASVGFPFAA